MMSNYIPFGDWRHDNSFSLETSKQDTSGDNQSTTREALP